MPLPSIGLLQYNGVKFDASANVRISCGYAKDASGRTTSHLRVVLTVDQVLASTNDESMQALRSKLGEHGKTLVYLGNAFPLSVNNPDDASSVMDVAFGPSPQIVDWKAWGGGTAAKMVWRCETTIPACGVKHSTFTLREFTYTISWSINENGYTTRTITGNYKIPMGRFSRASGAGARNIVETADSYRKQLLNVAAFRPLPGFKRRQSFSLSADKASENFTLLDTQIESENAYPPYVMDINARHDVARQSGRSAVSSQNRLSAVITLQPGYSAAWAWAVFRWITDSRLNAAKNRARELGGEVIIESISAQESLFGKTHSFSVGYRISGGISNGGVLLGEEFLTIAGFADPMPNGNDWSQWHESRLDIAGSNSGAVNGLRGVAGMGWATDRIIDQCDAIPIDVFTRLEGYPTSPMPTNSTSRSTVWKARCPKKENSWLAYWHNWQLCESSAKFCELRKLAGIKTKDLADKEKVNLEESALTEKSGASNSYDQRVSRTFGHGRGQVWILKGGGRRACYELPRLPKSIPLRDQKVTLYLVKHEIDRKVETSPLGLKVHSGDFAAVYVPDKPLDHPPPNVSYP